MPWTVFQAEDGIRDSSTSRGLGDVYKRQVDAVLGGIGDALGRGDSVSLVGFGTFSVRHRAAREGRNPQTGASMHIAASKVPGFKAGKGLKDKVKNG